MLPIVIVDIISQYSAGLKLLDWVDLDKLDWECLSRNPNAIHLLEKNLDKVDWENFVQIALRIFPLPYPMRKILRTKNEVYSVN